MERVIKFIARDQQEFKTEKECITHERSLDFTEAFSEFVVTHVGATPCSTAEAQEAFDRLSNAIRSNPDAFEAVLNAARGKGVKKVKPKKKRTSQSEKTKAQTENREIQVTAIVAKWLAIENPDERLAVVEELHTIDPKLFEQVRVKLGEAFFAALPKPPAAPDDETPPEPAD